MTKYFLLTTVSFFISSLSLAQDPSDTTYGCDVLLNKGIAQWQQTAGLPGVLESKGYNVTFSSPRNKYDYLKLEIRLFKGASDQCQGGNISCITRSAYQLVLVRVHVIDGIPTYTVLFEKHKIKTYYNNNDNDKNERKFQKAVTVAVRRFSRRLPPCGDL